MGLSSCGCVLSYRAAVPGKASSFIRRLIPNTKRSSSTLVPSLVARRCSFVPGQIPRLTDLQLLKTKSIIYSAVTLIGAVWMYRFLNSGGWLTHHYQLNQLNDPDSLNLIPVIFEPIAVLGVVAYWVWRTRELYRLLFFLFLGQLLIGASYLAVFLLFVLTYKPRMM